MLLKTKEEKLAKLCQEIYEESEQRFQPLYPWVLVRVLPKETKIGGIWTPDTAQNKPIYEGIVLEPWAPFYDNKSNSIRSSQFQTGDRIAFPSFEGAPVSFLDDKYYRIVREIVNFKDYPNCGIYGWIHYDQDVRIKDELNALMKEIGSVSISGT